MSLLYSAVANRQMAEIYRYIARDNPPAAQNVLRRIIEVAEFVAAHPGAGHATTLCGVRAIPANPYPYVLYFRREGTACGCCASCMPRGGDPCCARSRMPIACLVNASNRAS